MRLSKKKQVCADYFFPTPAMSAKARPLRLSAVFGRMLSECPLQVAAYGQCVGKSLSNLQKDACAAEFAAMKQCSERVLASARRK